MGVRVHREFSQNDRSIPQNGSIAVATPGTFFRFTIRSPTQICNWLFEKKVFRIGILPEVNST